MMVLGMLMMTFGVTSIYYSGKTPNFEAITVYPHTGIVAIVITIVVAIFSFYLLKPKRETTLEDDSLL